MNIADDVNFHIVHPCLVVSHLHAATLSILSWVKTWISPGLLKLGFAGWSTVAYKSLSDTDDTVMFVYNGI